MTVAVLRGDARRLPLPDASVDLIMTSPPYFGLRSYTDAGEHYAGQIGSEATPGEWLAALLACTVEWVRVLKPEGSIFVNLGDKYDSSSHSMQGVSSGHRIGQRGKARRIPVLGQPKCLMGLPWRYALGCVDQLGLILRAEIIWAKPNGLPESVTDRVRRSHEQVFHLVRQPRYYAAVDEIREPHTGNAHPAGKRAAVTNWESGNGVRHRTGRTDLDQFNPLGKLPGSVWDIPSAPLVVPPRLGVDHFACVDADTEILAQRGWLRHDQLAEGDQVAGYDLGTNTARWTDCTAVNRYDYDGDMIAIESRDLSMRLTPNHRTIVQRMDSSTKRRNPVTVVRADELDRYHFIPRSAAWETFRWTQAAGWPQENKRRAALLGWVAAEGWYQGRCVYLSQSLDANPQHVAEIDRLVTDGHRNERKRNYQGREYTEVTWRIGPVEELIQHHMPDKLLPWWLVMSTETERRAALDAFIAGDGHRRPDGRIGIFQKHRHNLDVLQAIAVTLGYKTTIREGGGRFVLYLTEGGRSVTLRGTAGVGTKIRREHYRGTVWCPTTGTGTFVARRNGSVFVTGNSFPPSLVRPVVLGWSPPGVCMGCGQGRRPVTSEPAYIRLSRPHNQHNSPTCKTERNTGNNRSDASLPYGTSATKLSTITGYVCACPTPDAPTRPALVVDPFGGTGTTALVASVYGRIGITVDLSADYTRLARWRTRDPGERARAMQVPKPPPVPDGQDALFAI